MIAKSLANRRPFEYPVFFRALGLALAVCLLATITMAGEPPAADVPAIAAARQRAVQFLQATQADDGSWTRNDSPGLAGLVTAALLESGVKPDDPPARQALEYLSKSVQPDGGIYFTGSSHRNYETSICLLAFHAANKDGKYDKLIANARTFLKKLQWDDDEGAARDDPKFGGAGYGKSQRPDLSNTTFLLDALKAAGVGPEDQAMKNALVFVSRCQNLESEHNTTPFASRVNDGGFYYTPAAGGNSQAGATDNGGLRSYGSMTYAGLKSMIYAGLGPDDPRVRAAYEWIRKHYTLAENPGMGQAGLYYYYHTFAKALDAMKLARFVDARGTEHDWRQELARLLLSQQKENGSWVNTDGKWMEGDPNLTTAYVLLTLRYCEPGAR
ncbi:MAG: prenyltransferase/squalene oxidase repeat-containing protein [Planctomycetaceae bacterium]